MAILKKVYQMFKGLDLRTSDLLRGEGTATDIDNSSYRQTGAWNKRKGFKYTADKDVGGFGTHTYSNDAVDTGDSTEELLVVDDEIHKVTTHSFTINYAGATPNTAWYSFLYEEDTVDFNSGETGCFVFRLYAEGSLRQAITCGKGDEGASVASAMSWLEANIDSNNNFSGAFSSPDIIYNATILPLTERTTIGTSLTVEFEIYETIDIPSLGEGGIFANYDKPFPLSYAQINDSNFENASFSEINGVLYISNGYDVLHKYDGNYIYKAGLPSPEDQSVAWAVGETTGGTFQTTETYAYILIYEFTDAKGNVVTSKHLVSEDHSVTVNNYKLRVTVPTIMDGTLAQEGWKTSTSLITATDTTNNIISLTESNVFKPGDYIYFQTVGGSAGPNDWTKRQIISYDGAGDYTYDGDPVTSYSGTYASSVKIDLYRTADYASAGTPGLYYNIKGFSNRTSTGSITFDDATPDATAIQYAQWVDPIKERGLPPLAKHIDQWRGQLIMSGLPTKVNKVAYSDIDSPEYFPSSDNSFLVNKKVTGHKVLDNVLYVFKKHSIDGVTGDFGDDVFQVDSLSREGIGCEANATIQEVKGKLFFLSSNGVFAIDRDGIANIGSPIDPDFAVGNSYNYKQATAFTWQADEKYILHMPVITSGTTYATSDSRTYAYDYFRGAWLKWSNYNLLGGMAEYNDQIYKFSRYANDVGTYTRWLHKIQQNNEYYDYGDHHEAISWSLGTPWFTEGEPNIPKKYLRCSLLGIDASLQDFESSTFTITASTNHNYDVSRDFSSITYDFGTETDGWGVSKWGISPYGYERLQQMKRNLSFRAVKSLRLNLSNSAMYENVLVSGIEFEIATPYKVDGGLKE